MSTKNPSCTQATALLWSGFLLSLPYSWWVQMPAPPTSFDSVWGEDIEVWLALGGPWGDHSLIRLCILSLSKVVINTVYILTANPDMPVLKPTSDSFQQLPPMLQKLLLCTHQSIIFARKPVPPSTAATCLLTTNLHNHTVPDNSSFEKKYNPLVSRPTPTQQDS
jgi:hypothetical protein